MLIISSYLSKIPYYFQLLSWKDPIEILFFSVILYYFSCWLSADKTKPLLPLFYVYCSILLSSTFFNFITVSSFLILYGPLMIMLLILVHQEVLQRNFVALKKITPSAQLRKDDWVELLIRSCLRTNTHNKSIMCIIEQTDNLDAFIEAPCILQTQIHEHLLSLILNSSSYDQKKMLWLAKQGTIIAVNSSWKKSIDKLWHHEELKDKTDWLATALGITQKTDALCLVCSADSATFDIIAQGKLVENISAASALRIVRHYFNVDPQALQKGEILYETRPERNKSSLDQFHR